LIDFNRDDPEIQKYFFGQKSGKRLGVPLAFFQFLAKNLFLIFQAIAIEFYRGTLKMIRTLVRCFII